MQVVFVFGYILKNEELYLINTLKIYKYGVLYKQMNTLW